MPDTSIYARFAARRLQEAVEHAAAHARQLTPRHLLRSQVDTYIYQNVEARYGVGAPTVDSLERARELLRRTVGQREYERWMIFREVHVPARISGRPGVVVLRVGNRCEWMSGGYPGMPLCVGVQLGSGLTPEDQIVAMYVAFKANPQRFLRISNSPFNWRTEGL